MGLLEFLRTLFAGVPAAERQAGREERSSRRGGPRYRRLTRSPITPQGILRNASGGTAGAGAAFRRLVGRLGLNHVRVRRLLHVPDAYRRFTIAKRGGGSRDILAPCRALKFVQRRILRRILQPLDRHPAAHGFRVYRGIRSNAAYHCGKEMVLSLDLADWFPSITSKRVYGLFRALGWPANLASVLTRLTTWEGRLPQGAPTSPTIANLIARRLDCRLTGLATRRQLTYTRYADDLALSGSAAEVRRVFPLVCRIIKEEGFELSARKTRFMRRGRRQTVTGLVVNEKAHVPRKYRRRIRAALHQLSTGRQAPVSDAERLAVLRELEGHVLFVRSISADHAMPLAVSLAKLKRQWTAR